MRDTFLFRFYVVVYFVCCLALALCYFDFQDNTGLFDIIFFYVCGTTIWYLAKTEYEKLT